MLVVTYGLHAIMWAVVEDSVKYLLNSEPVAINGCSWKYCSVTREPVVL